jgi:lambda family phage portal protein
MQNPITSIMNMFRGSTALAAVPALGGSLNPRAFDGGKNGRRLAAIPSTTTAINDLIRTYGRSAIARSRYLCTNNPYALAAKEAFTTAVAGFGIKPSSLIEDAAVKKKVQQLWLDSVQELDADGVTDFYGMQGLAAAELFEAGEVFFIRSEARPGRYLTTPLRLRMVPAEMLPYEYTIPSYSGKNKIVMGIEFDEQGNRVAYHFLKKHPGTNALLDTADYGYQRILAENVIHLFKPIRVGQIRGVPHTLASLVSLSMLDLYDDAELERKRVAALFAAFVTTAPQVGDDADNGTHPLGASNAGGVSSSDQFAMEPGAVIDLLPGETVNFSEPADVGANYEGFQYRNLLRAAAGMGVPYISMTGDLRQANYGSIRAGLVEFRRRVTALQHGVMVHQLCRPVWTWWMDGLAFLGTLPMSRTAYMRERAANLRAKYIPPRWDWVDPLKDRQAEKLAVDNGFKARSDVQEEEGYDPEETDDRILADQNRAETLGLKLNTGAVLPPSEDPAAGDSGEEDIAGQPPREKPDNA